MRATLSCNEDGWGLKLLDYLKDHREVDLLDFDLLAHSKFCNDTARKFGMLTDFNPNTRTLRIFNPKLILRSQKG